MNERLRNLVTQARNYAATAGLRAEPSAALLADELERICELLEFRPISNLAPPDGMPILGRNEAWKHPDYNPSGIRECWRFEGAWESAQWNPDMGRYESDYTTAPTEWMNPIAFSHPS